VTLLRLAPTATLASGLATMGGALLWWALTYWQVWTYDYLSLPQAGRCLVTDSTICRLAASLCTGEHRTFVAIYSPLALWTGALFLVGGLAAQQAVERP
jgi:hypothetical protein